MSSSSPTTAPTLAFTQTPLPANWHHTQQPSLIGATVLLLVLTNAAVFVKVYLRLRAQKRLFYDDWSLLASLFLSDGLLSINFVAIKAGLGLHASRVLGQDPSPPNKLIIEAKVVWTNSVLTAPTLFLVKLAILLFLRRTFLFSESRSSHSSRATSTSTTNTHSEKKSLRSWRSSQSVSIKDLVQKSEGWLYTTWCLNLAYAICMAIATTIIFICQIRPVDFYWNEFFYLLNIPSPRPHPTHIHLVKYPYAGTGVPEAVNEFFIVLWSIVASYTVRKKMSRVRIQGLSFLFALSLFACCCGVAKIVYSYDARPDNDFSWNATSLVLWACTQISVAQIIACLPTVILDSRTLHFDHNGYLTKLWPPHPIHVHMPDMFHVHNRPNPYPNSHPNSATVNGVQRPSMRQRNSSRWSRFSLAAAAGGGKKKRSARNPSLDSDFEWVTTPPHRTDNYRSNQSNMEPDHTSQNVELGEAHNIRFQRDRDNFFDDSTSGSFSSGLESRDSSFSSTETGIMPAGYHSAGYDIQQYHDYPEML